MYPKLMAEWYLWFLHKSITNNQYKIIFIRDISNNLCLMLTLTSIIKFLMIKGLRESQ